jgi:hypothetical protein
MAQRREERLREKRNAVAPPDEAQPTRNSTKHQQHHLLDSTLLINPSSSQKLPTNTITQDVAHDYFTHPFLPVTNGTPTMDVSGMNAEANDPRIHTPLAIPITVAVTKQVAKMDKTLPELATPATSTSIPWLAFMMDKKAPTNTRLYS